MRSIHALLALSLLTAGALRTFAGPTLDKVRAEKKLRCGVDFEEVEYSTRDAHGNHSAFDLDVCKAIAVATLGPGAEFIAVPYRDEQDAIEGLQSGQVAVLATGSVNFMNTAAASIGFARPIFYDYQGLLVNKAAGIHSAKDLAGKKTCFIDGTELQEQIQSFMQREAIAWIPFPFQEEGEMEAAFLTRNCAAITADVSQLAFERIAFRSMAREFVILPDVIAMDPLAPAYRLDDPQWAAIVNWTVDALLQAEQSGITRANLSTTQRSTDLTVGRLLGTRRGYGQYLGLNDRWAADVIAAVGNYGELFDRNLGAQSPMQLARGANRLWTEGGLMAPAPIR